MCSLSYIYKLLCRDTVVKSSKTLNSPKKVKSSKTLNKIESDITPKTLNKIESNKLPTYMSYKNMQALCDIQDNRNDYGFNILN